MRIKKLAPVANLIKEAYLQDNTITIRDLAEAHNCSPGSIRSCLIEQGVKLRPRGRRKTNQLPSLLTPLTTSDTLGAFHE